MENALTASAPIDTTVDLRCSVLVLREDAVLLMERIDGHRRPRHHTAPSEWVLPGGRPHPGESLAACARREAREESGLLVDVGRCQFVLEVAAEQGRVVDLVFAARPVDPRDEPVQAEVGLRPAYVPLDELPQLQLRPPLAGHIRGLRPHRDRGAAYLGNLWRPDKRPLNMEE